MMSIQVKPETFIPELFRVRVRFDPHAENQFTFPNGHQMKVTKYLALIIFELETAPGVPPATFATFPCQPIDSDGSSINMPKNILHQFQDQDDQHLLFLDLNPGIEQREMNFRLEINCEDKFYVSHDPTIINAEIPNPPPVDPGGDDGEGPLPELLMLMAKTESYLSLLEDRLKSEASDV